MKLIFRFILMLTSWARVSRYSVESPVGQGNGINGREEGSAKRLRQNACSKMIIHSIRKLPPHRKPIARRNHKCFYPSEPFAPSQSDITSCYSGPDCLLNSSPFTPPIPRNAIRTLRSRYKFGRTSSLHRGVTTYLSIC
jgi:hypothetical protein